MRLGIRPHDHRIAWSLSLACHLLLWKSGLWAYLSCNHARRWLIAEDEILGAVEAGLLQKHEVKFRASEVLQPSREKEGIQRLFVLLSPQKKKQRKSVHYQRLKEFYL